MGSTLSGGEVRASSDKHNAVGSTNPCTEKTMLGIDEEVSSSFNRLEGALAWSRPVRRWKRRDDHADARPDRTRGPRVCEEKSPRDKRNEAGGLSTSASGSILATLPG